MRTTLLILVLSAVLPAWGLPVDSILGVLKSEIRQRPEYMRQKETRIDVLKSTLNRHDNARAQFERLSDLYNEYCVYQGDSARAYASQMYELARGLGAEERLRASVNLAHCYQAEGFYKEAADVIDKIDTTGVSIPLIIKYMTIKAQYVQNLANYTEAAPEISAAYNRMFADISHRIPVYASALHDATLVEKLHMSDSIYTSEPRRSLALSKRYMKKFDLDNQEKAVIYYVMADNAKTLGMADSAIYYLAASAICDIRGNVRETRATTTLADMLFERGNIDDAATFITQAKNDADFYNAHTRNMEIDRINIKIENERLLRNEHRQMLTTFIIMGVVVSVIILFAITIVLRKQNRKLRVLHTDVEEKRQQLDVANLSLRNLNTDLNKVNAIKNEYIIRSICTDHSFINQMEERIRTISRKVAARQYADLDSELNFTGIKKERRRIACEFDSGFLSIFPNFLDEFNKLFPPGEGYELTDEGLLPNEVRIYGLLRLGVSDTDLVSRYLNISQNTIYVYKARVKARSTVPKDQFDAEVMKIPQP